MKKMVLMAIIAVFVLAVGIGTAPATLINGGFETGDLTGWTAYIDGGSASVYNDFGTYTPVEGNYFAVLTAGTAYVYQTIYQTINLNAGDKIEGYAGFYDNDFWNDNAYVKINGLVLWSWNDSLGNSGWMKWSYIAPTTGSYDLQYGIENYGDDKYSSSAVFDAATTSSVPEPASLMLLGFGLVGLAGFRRRIKN